MTRCRGKQCRLLCMLSLTFSFFLVELIVGYITNSMALVADSFHMLTDVLAIIVAFFSVKMSSKNWHKNTYGWARAEVLGALVNAVFLLALCFSIFIESLQRLYRPEEVQNVELLLIVGCVGLAVNLIGLLMFHDHGHSHGDHGHSHGSKSKTSSESTRRHSHNSNTGQINHSYSGETVEQEHNTHSHDSDQQNHNSQNNNHDNETNDNDHTNYYKNIQLESNPITHIIDSKNNTTVDISHQIPIDSEVQNEDQRTPDIIESNTHSKNHKSDSQMNIRGVFLHILSDALGSVIVIVSALVVWLTDWEYTVYIDPVLSISLVVLITITTVPLLKDTSFILLQGIPTNIEIDNVSKLILNVEGVLDVHELHVWMLKGQTIVASAHVKCSNIKRYANVADAIKVILHKEGIHSTTIQQEFVDTEKTDSAAWLSSKDCVVKCPADDNQGCLRKSCCAISDKDILNTN